MSTVLLRSTASDLEPPPYFDAKVLDGPAIVHSLPVKEATTFDDYSDMVFIPWTKQMLQNSDRIDIIWDVYKPGSLKECTREKRGRGVRRKVSGTTKLPSKFKDFLRDSMNKEELFSFLTDKVSKCAYYSQGKAKNTST